MEITKDMRIAELIRVKPEAVEILLSFGLGKGAVSKRKAHKVKQVKER